MVVFRDGSHYLQFPNIELTPVSVANGVYTYSFGSQVTVTLDTNTNPATFSGTSNSPTIALSAHIGR